jgi:hypothetical protein
VPRVRQLKAQALDKLRAALGDEFDVHLGGKASVWIH